MNQHTTQEDEDAKKDSRLNSILLFAIGGVLVLWISITWIILKMYGGVDDPNELGDTFGAVNALFTSLAFAFLIYTALLQKRELEYQRRELKETKEEIAKSAAAQEMLVKLTEEQLELQKQIRKSQVLPELGLRNKNWITKPGVGWVLKIELGAKENKVKPYRVDIFGKDYGFKCINIDELSKYYVQEKHAFELELFRGEGNKFEPVNMKVRVFYYDIDERMYKQTITFEEGRQYIGNPETHSLADDLI